MSDEFCDWFNKSWEVCMHMSSVCWDFQQAKIDKLTKANEVLKSACEKISDPRKRDHKEPDKYTELGCVMNMANEALEKYREIMKEK